MSINKKVILLISTILIFVSCQSISEENKYFIRIFQESSYSNDYYLIVINPDTSKRIGYNLKTVLNINGTITKAYISADNRFLYIHNLISKSKYTIIQYNLETKEKNETALDNELIPMSYVGDNHYLIGQLNNEHSISYKIIDLKEGTISDIYTYENLDIKLYGYFNSITYDCWGKYLNLYDEENKILYFKPINESNEEKGIASCSLSYYIFEEQTSKLTEMPDWEKITQFYNNEIVVCMKENNWRYIKEGYFWYLYNTLKKQKEPIAEYRAKYIRILPDGKKVIMTNSKEKLILNQFDVFPFIALGMESITFDTLVIDENNTAILNWYDKVLSKHFYKSAQSMYFSVFEPNFDKKYRIDGRVLYKIINAK